MQGIIIINKPGGMTSHDVVSFMRRKTGVRRIGHSGTLDPMAEGVLPVFIGRATRMIEYADRQGDTAAKKYRCTMRLGLTTDTLDIWGNITNETDTRGVTHFETERVLKSFEGAGMQKPPLYSAIKVGGRKLYEYARSGKEIDEDLIKERPIFIEKISVAEFRDKDDMPYEVVFDIVCSKGVYVRTICGDAGRMLGCGAVMSGLVRLASGGFTIEDSVALSELEDKSAEEIERLLKAPEDALLHLPRVELDEENEAHFVCGRFARETGADTLVGNENGTAVCIFGSSGFMGIGIYENGIIKPHKVMK